MNSLMNLVYFAIAIVIVSGVRFSTAQADVSGEDDGAASPRFEGLRHDGRDVTKFEVGREPQVAVRRLVTSDRLAHTVLPVRFDSFGTGGCRDGKGNKYDYAYSYDALDIESCMSLCALTAHGGALVGLEVSNEDCRCLFTDGFLEKRGVWFADGKSEYFDFDGLGFDGYSNQGGIGEVVNLDSTWGWGLSECYKVTVDTPVLGPTSLRTQVCNMIGNDCPSIGLRKVDEGSEGAVMCCQDTQPGDDITCEGTSECVETDFHTAFRTCKEMGARLCTPDEMSETSKCYWSEHVGDCYFGNQPLWACIGGRSACSSNADCCSGICGGDGLCWPWAMGKEDTCAAL